MEFSDVMSPKNKTQRVESLADELDFYDQADESFNEPQYYGIIPRAIDEIFNGVADKLDQDSNIKYTIYCSFMQIYNEKLYDLLQDNKNIRPLKIREEKFNDIYVEGLSEYVINNARD